MKRYLSLFVSVLLILSLFTGCGSSSSYEGSAAEVPMEEMGPMNAPMDQHSAEPGKTRLPENRKWVITSEVQAETENLDETLDGVLARVNELQGYVEDQNFDNGSYYGGYDADRSARMTVRIPAESIDSFMKTVEERTNVVSSSRNLKDITLQYTDTETRITALKTEEERLLSFMEKAQTIEEMLEIERRLTDVHYELENVSSRLRTYDNQVDFATIHLNINEVRQYTPVEEPGFLEKITTGFAASVEGVWEGIKNFVIFIIVSSPYLLVWGIIIAAVLLIVRACQKKKKAAQKQDTVPVSEPQQVPESWKKFDQAKKEESPKNEKK